MFAQNTSKKPIMAPQIACASVWNVSAHSLLRVTESPHHTCFAAFATTPVALAVMTCGNARRNAFDDPENKPVRNENVNRGYSRRRSKRACANAD